MVRDAFATRGAPGALLLRRGLQAVDQLPITRLVAQGVEIGVLLDVIRVVETGLHGRLERLEGLARLPSGERVGAREVVERELVLRVDAPGDLEVVDRLREALQEQVRNAMR
jgi:hypothetical protein